MKTLLTKKELGNDLLYDTLKALSACFKRIGVPFYVIGATARDITMKLLGEEDCRRRTNGLDVAIAIQDWNDFDKVRAELQAAYFEKDAAKQKFFYRGENGKNDFEVDIVPFGGIEVDEQICWPPESNPVMSVKCFTEVMEHAVTVSLDDVITFRTAPICGQFLIKFDAWHDRNDKTEKDVADMASFLLKYFEYMVVDGTVRPPGEINLDDAVDFAVISAGWLAYDMCRLLSDRHLQDYAEVIRLELEKKEKSRLLLQFIKELGDREEGKRFELAFEIWDNIRQIITQTLKNRTDENC